MAERAFQTVQISSRVLAHGELVEHFGNGEVLVRDGAKLYRGRPIAVRLGGLTVRPTGISMSTSYA